MIAVLVISVLATLWILAIRYGYDSREGPPTKEQELASYGVSWCDLTDPWALPLLARERLDDLRRSRADAAPSGIELSSLRAGLARRLRAVADRLEPEGCETWHAHA